MKVMYAKIKFYEICEKLYYTYHPLFLKFDMICVIIVVTSQTWRLNDVALVSLLLTFTIKGGLTRNDLYDTIMTLIRC